MKNNDMFVCIWKYSNDDYEEWETSCGQSFILNEGRPTENDMRYCCYCGKPLREEIKT